MQAYCPKCRCEQLALSVGGLFTSWHCAACGETVIPSMTPVVPPSVYKGLQQAREGKFAANPPDIDAEVRELDELEEPTELEFDGETC